MQKHFWWLGILLIAADIVALQRNMGGLALGLIVGGDVAITLWFSKFRFYVFFGVLIAVALLLYSIRQCLKIA